MILGVDPFYRELQRVAPSDSYLIAYSGGMDSRVLLELLFELKQQNPRIGVEAVHIDHGLHADSQAWAGHCVSVCETISIPIRVIRVDAVPGRGQSPEEAARNARYGALGSLVTDSTVMLTAQHLDDQAESVLLQMLRGGGLRGLSGIPLITAFGRGLLCRPLLGFTRRSIEEFARSRGLEWIDDPSNLDTSIERNYLRREIIPRLQSRWPAMAVTIARAGQHCAEAQTLLDRLAGDQLALVRIPGKPTLDTERLAGFSEAEQRLILRRWIRLDGRRCPSESALQQVVENVLCSARHRSPIVRWSEGEIRRYRRELYLMSLLPEFDGGQQLDWDGSSELKLPCGAGSLQFVSGAGEWAAEAVSELEFTVRFRRGGERCLIPGRRGHHSLKNLFQENAVPTWLRDRIPLLYMGGELAAVADLVICVPLYQRLVNSGLRLKWSRTLPL